ncbi:MAG: phosphotransferase, partial [Planctomycetes bacterium]|nr:phosphotransferase [Planctomycetota bacterium]
TPATHPRLCEALGPPPQDPAQRAIQAATQSLDALGEPRPALEAALAWLRAHAPPPGELSLVHGDFRTGNLLVTPEGLSAVLDWEFARWSSPAEDLAWLCVRDWRFGRLELPVGGFGERAPFLAAYAEAAGGAPSEDALHWWEVLGNVRWAAGSLQQGRRYLAGERDLELAAIARRAAEMEYEALRLVDRRPVWSA